MNKFYSPVLVNAEEFIAWARGDPGPYYVFTNAALDSLRAGNLVKVRDISEQFWVRVTEIWEVGNARIIYGRIGNHLSAEKSYGFGDVIRFGVENVFDLCQGTDEELHRLERQGFSASEGVE